MMMLVITKEKVTEVLLSWVCFWIVQHAG